jgi:hypothetical protein
MLDRLFDIYVTTIESVVTVLHGAVRDRKRRRGGLRPTDSALRTPLVGEDGDERSRRAEVVLVIVDDT